MNKNLALSILIFIQILFGINFTTSKIIVQKLDPILWSNIRFLIAGLILLIFTLLSKRKHPQTSKKFWGNLIVLSLLGMALGQGLFLFGLKYTSSINTSIITTTIPILTLFIVVMRKQEELSWPKLVGIILGFFGVVLIIDLSKLQFTSNSFIGDLLVFLGALCFALYLSFGKKFLQKYDNLWVTSYMFIISGLFMMIINIPKLVDFNFPQMDGVFIVSVIFTILGATLLTYVLNNLVLKHVSPAQIALFIYLQPIVAGLFGVYFLGEDISLRTLICFLLILSGVIISINDKAIRERF